MLSQAAGNSTLLYCLTSSDTWLDTWCFLLFFLSFTLSKCYTESVRQFGNVYTQMILSLSVYSAISVRRYIYTRILLNLVLHLLSHTSLWNLRNQRYQIVAHLDTPLHGWGVVEGAGCIIVITIHLV